MGCCRSAEETLRCWSEQVMSTARHPHNAASPPPDAKACNGVWSVITLDSRIVFFRAVTYGAVFDYLKKGGTVHFDQHRHLWGTCFGAPIYNPPQRSCRGESFCPRGLTATSEKGQNHGKQICFVPHRML